MSKYLKNFFKKCNLILEEINKEKIKLEYDKFLNVIPTIDDVDFFNLAIQYISLKELDLNEYEPLISGDSTIKIVPNGVDKGSIIKLNGSQCEKLFNGLNVERIKINKTLNLLFYLGKFKQSQDSNYSIRVSGSSSLDAETKQINDAKNRISDFENFYVRTPDDQKRGPFNDIEKVPGVPKADAVLKSNQDDDMYLSLKLGPKKGEFRQFGGKTDLAKNDVDLVENYEFVGNCYSLIKKLFDVFSIKYENIKENDYDFKYLRNYIPDVNFSQLSFLIPESDEDEFLKAKFGKDFGNNEPGVHNVDVMIDGYLNFNELSDDIEEKSDNSKTISLDGKYHTEWNPDLYDVEHEKDETYDMVITFIRYNANDEGTKTNQLSFNEFKHCRFQIYPKNKLIKNINETKNLFERYGLNYTPEFLNIYQKNEDNKK